jgi:CRP/FNR family cyclic AMP-dependent transcriptional regulator
MELNYRTSCSPLEDLGPASSYVDEIMAIIDRLPLFEDMTPHEVIALCQHMHCYGAPRGINLVREGDTGDYLMVILTGSVVVSKAEQCGAKVYATVGPGACLGEMSMIDGEPRFASCITARPTDFAVLSRNDLNRILVDFPRLGNKFLLLLLQMMTRRLRDASVRLLPHIVGTAI